MEEKNRNFKDSKINLQLFAENESTGTENTEIPETGESQETNETKKDLNSLIESLNPEEINELIQKLPKNAVDSLIGKNVNKGIKTKSEIYEKQIKDLKSKIQKYETGGEETIETLSQKLAEKEKEITLTNLKAETNLFLKDYPEEIREAAYEKFSLTFGDLKDPISVIKTIEELYNTMNNFKKEEAKKLNKGSGAGTSNKVKDELTDEQIQEQIKSHFSNNKTNKKTLGDFIKK